MTTAQRDCLAILADELDPPSTPDEPDYLGGWQPLPHQQAPPGDEWRYWLIRAGRGAGKTDAGARYLDQQARRSVIRVRIIAPTLDDARETCVRGESGLLVANPRIRFVSPRRLQWPNGSTGLIYGAFTPEDAERLRGPQAHIDWYDELASWRYLEDVWHMARFGLRLGDRPHAIITTTPKPRPRIRRLIRDPKTVVASATTDDNPHLNALIRADLFEEYEGTAFEAQELRGEIVEVEEDVVVPLPWIDRCQQVIERPDVPMLPVELGVDVGAGGDESVIRERRGPVVGRVWRDRQRDTMRVVAKTVEAIETTGASAVKVDVVGIGAGVSDRLEELRLEGRHRAEIVRVNAGSKSATPERYVNLRAELWWGVGRKLTEDGAWDLSALDEGEVDQLSATKYRHDSAGRIVIEPKDETKARIGRSPDDADALLLAFYAPPRERGWRIRR